MTLDEYLDKYGIQKSEFAEKLGKSAANFTCLVRRSTTPNLITALAIYDLTSGEVTYREMLSFYDANRFYLKYMKPKGCEESK